MGYMDRIAESRRFQTAMQDDEQASKMALAKLDADTRVQTTGMTNNTTLQNTQLGNQGALERTALGNQGSMDIARAQYSGGVGVVGGTSQDPWKAKLGFANSGIIPGKVNPNVADDITINAKKGEYIIPQEVVEVLGAKKLDKLVKDARKQIGVPHKTGPKRHDEPDALGRMDDPRLGERTGYGKGAVVFGTTGSEEERAANKAAYAEKVKRAQSAPPAEYEFKNSERNIVAERPFVVTDAQGNKKSQFLGAIGDRVHNFFQSGTPATDEAAASGVSPDSAAPSPSYAQAASAATSGSAAGQAPSAGQPAPSAPKRSDLEAYAKQVSKEAEGKHGMQYLGGDGKWKSVGNNLDDTPAQAEAKAKGQLVQDANGNWVQPLGGGSWENRMAASSNPGDIAALSAARAAKEIADKKSSDAFKLKQMDVDANDKKAKAAVDVATIKADAEAKEKDREEKSKHQQYAYKDAIEQYDWSGISPNAQHETATVMAKTAGKGYETFVHPDGKSGDMMIHPQLLKGINPRDLEAARKNPALFQELVNRLHEAGGGQGIERLPVRNMAGLKRLKSSTT